MASHYKFQLFKCKLLLSMLTIFVNSGRELNEDAPELLCSWSSSVLKYRHFQNLQSSIL